MAQTNATLILGRALPLHRVPERVASAIWHVSGDQQ